MPQDRHPIKLLDEELINKIAAGEVVERPASVVKELVENSIDAGAGNITVTIRDGGKKLIQVTDDGCGIPPDELELAVSRHATSKIGEFDDLFKLTTKGFRGEALASIGAVGKLTVASLAHGYEPNAITVNGGGVEGVSACAHGGGTTVTVKYLFYQTPARLKFMRSRATETSHIVTAVHRLALSHPRVAFRLIDDGKTLFDDPVHDDGKKRVLAVLGGNLKDDVFPFTGERPGIKVSGWFGHPQIALSQRSDAYFFVNGRAVNDKTLWHAVSEAYRDLLMKGKYPVIVLNLAVDEATLDVNVHPAKSEVRFHNSQQVHSAVKEILREHLRGAPWVVREHDATVATTGNAGQAPVSPQESFPALSASTINRSLESWSREYFKPDVSSGALARADRVKDYSVPNQAGIESPVAQALRPGMAGGPAIAFGGTPYAAMRPIGQFMGTYILCEAGERLALIDQHAAHERVGFEKLLRDFEGRGIPREALLIPETFDLNPSDAEILKKYLEELEKFGLEVEYFGGHTFVIKAVPTLFKSRGTIPNMIRDIIADLKETGELTSLTDKLHHVLATMACHGQIRAHHRLTTEEMYALLNDLENHQFTDFCPHGRPVAVEMSKGEIEKWFKRVL